MKLRRGVTNLALVILLSQQGSILKITSITPGKPYYSVKGVTPKDMKYNLECPTVKAGFPIRVGNSYHVVIVDKYLFFANVPQPNTYYGGCFIIKKEKR